MLEKIVRKKKRRGRGIGRSGAKSGRGMKGQRSRAGYRRKAGFEGGQTPLYMRLPKGRGTKQRFPSQVRKPTAVNVRSLCSFKEGSIVGIGALRKLGLIDRKSRYVKLIGSAELSGKLTVRVHAATLSAQKSVKDAGGKVEIIQ